MNIDINTPTQIIEVVETQKLSKGIDKINDRSFILEDIYDDYTEFKKSNLSSHVAEYCFLQDNWDGYEAVVPYAESIGNCINFLDRLPENIVRELDTENIYPTNYGTIVLDLINNNGEKTSIEFGKTKIGFYTDFEDGINYHEEGKIFNHSFLPADLISAITKLYKAYIL